MINSIALSLLLGFELSYYLLIVQTGIVTHYDSDLIILFPMFAGGVLGTVLGGRSWGNIENPVDKIIIALTLQLLLSFNYPHYNVSTLFLLGIAVGLMAPLGIYLFKAHQQKELFFALEIAYTIGTYLFTSDVEIRMWMAVAFSAIALLSAVILKNYKVERDAKVVSHSFISYFPLMLWILLDSNLFESLSRNAGMNIWSHYTFMIIIFHVIGLLSAYFINMTKSREYIYISVAFLGSYIFYFLEWPFLLAILYPFTNSYYKVVVFTTLSQEVSLSKLAYMMILVGWIASGLGLAIALSKILH